MEELAIYLLKSAGVLAVFILIYHFLLRRLTFFQSNRWFLLFGLFASIVFPLIEITQTVYVEQPVTLSPQQLAYTPMEMLLDNVAPGIPTSIEQNFDYETLWFAIYTMLALFFIGKMSLELVSLFKLIRSGEVRKSGPFFLVSLSRKLTPFSFFQYICFSRNEDKQPEFEVILNHEKVHARQWHSMDVIISTAYRAVFWFNPLAWLVKRQITENLEFIADAQAKTNNTSSISYERTLLRVMACQRQPALANNFFTPFIKQRIVMLQKETSARWQAYKYALILPIIVLFLYSFNVVEEIQYVDPINESAQKEVVKTEEDVLIFEIKPNSTNAEINLIAQQISAAYDYQFNILEISRQNDLVSKLDIRIAFPQDPENIHRFSMGKVGKALNKILLLSDRKSVQLREIGGFILFNVSRSNGIELKLSETGIAAPKLELSAEDSSEKLGPNPLHVFNDQKLRVSEIPKGTTISCDERVVLNPTEAIKRYGARAKDGAIVYKGKTVVTRPTNATHSDEIIFIKITSKTTQKQLDEKVAKLKSLDIDFDIQKAKFKKGNLIKLKFSLNDNKGYQSTLSDDTKEGIKDVCITRILKEGNNKAEWLLDRCESVPWSFLNNSLIKDAMVDVKNVNVEEMRAKMLMQDAIIEQRIASIQQHLATISKDSALVTLQMTAAQRDQHVALIKQHVATISRDTVLLNQQMNKEQMEVMLKKIDLNIRQVQGIGMDSIKSVIHVNRVKLDSLKNNVQHAVKSQNSIYTRGEVYYDGELIKKADPLPIYMVNGKELSKEDYDRIPQDKLKSAHVLRSGEAIDKYGEKGKWGVFEIQVEEDYKLIEVKKPAGTTTSGNRKFSAGKAHAARKQLLHILNGKTITDEELLRVPTASIESLTVLKDKSAVALYGDKGKDGVILITTKKDFKSVKVDGSTGENAVVSVGNVYGDGKLIHDPNNSPYILINGKPYSDLDLNRIPSDKIKSVNVFKGVDATSRYGEKGKNGVVIIAADEDFELLDVKAINYLDASKDGFNYEVGVSSYSFEPDDVYSNVERTDQLVTLDSEMLDTYAVKIKKEGYDIKIRTFRTKNGKLTKLKLDLDGSSYTIQANNEIEELNFTYYKDGRQPTMTSISR
jgi:TonB-dependent SusC/RagA subfamily outer membrane receptor